MSLILDALMKLEREKQPTPRGFLVVAPGAWAGRGRGASVVGISLLVGLVLGAGLLAAYGKMSQAAAPPSPDAPPDSTLAPAPVAPPAAAVVAPSPRIRAARSAPPSTLPAPAVDAPDGPRLQAISEQDGHPVAVIDEQVMREGDERDGMKVLRIGAAEVEIEHLGKRRILRF